MSYTADSFDRHRAAEMLAANPLWNQLLEHLKTDAVNTWKGSTSAAQREEQWMRLRCVEELEKKLEIELNDAKVEADKRRRAERRAAAA